MYQPITLNKFAYANSDPINGMDPSGLATLGELNTSVTIVQNERRQDTSYSLQSGKKLAADLCAAAAGGCKMANNAYKEMRKITGGTPFQSHHIFQDSVMTDLYGGLYKRSLGFAIALLGGAGDKGSPHDIANIIQGKLKGKNIAYVAYASLRGAGCRAKDATEIILAAQNYNAVMGWK